MNGECVRLLLERENVDADSKDNDGRSPLSWAAESEDEPIVRLLLERMDVEADSKDNNGDSPLSWALRLPINDPSRLNILSLLGYTKCLVATNVES